MKRILPVYKALLISSENSCQLSCVNDCISKKTFLLILMSTIHSVYGASLNKEKIILCRVRNSFQNKVGFNIEIEFYLLPVDILYNTDALKELGHLLLDFQDSFGSKIPVINKTYIDQQPG